MALWVHFQYTISSFLDALATGGIDHSATRTFTIGNLFGIFQLVLDGSGFPYLSGPVFHLAN